MNTQSNGCGIKRLTILKPKNKGDSSGGKEGFFLTWRSSDLKCSCTVSGHKRLLFFQLLDRCLIFLAFIPWRFIFWNKKLFQSACKNSVHRDTFLPWPLFQSQQIAKMTAWQFNLPVWLNTAISPTATGFFVLHSLCMPWPAALLRAMAQGFWSRSRFPEAVPTRILA